jgi:preprotein translocase subunit Sss1
MIEDTRPVVKSKASTRFIERIAKHPDWKDFVKALSQRQAEV